MASEDFANNIAIIDQRWPYLAEQLRLCDYSHLNANLVVGKEQTISINNIQLSSRHNRRKEAQLLASQAPEQTEVLNIYGHGLGDLQREILQRKNVRLVRIVILNIAIFRLVLQHSWQGDWLAHPSIELAEPSTTPKILKPFIINIPELSLADKKNSKLCDHLLTAIQQRFIYKDHQTLHPVTAKHIQENITLIKHDLDVGNLFNSRPGCEAIVIGSGPSLETHYPLIINYFAQQQPPLIIAVDTALKALDNYEITPDIVITVDHEIQAQHLAHKHSQQIKLAYLPGVAQSALLNWQGKRYTAYSESKLYDELYHQHPKGRLYAGGSVIHSAVDLAAKIGATSITLFGCDFSFPNNKTHAGWQENELGLNHHQQQCSLLNGYQQPVDTVPNFRSYLCVLEDYIVRHPHIKFYNASREGALIAGTQYIEGINHGYN